MLLTDVQSAARRAMFAGAALITVPGCAQSRQAEGASAPSNSGATNTVAYEMPACIDTGDDPPGLTLSDPQRAAAIPCIRYNVDIEGAPTRGPADAPVTIVMFSDFECPFCERAMQTINAIERQYEGKVRVAYKSFPLGRHPQALVAALMALSARDQGAFWAFHDRLFSGGGIDTPTLLGYAEALGLDLERIAQELDDMIHAPEVRADLEQAEQLLVRSTPTFFINGRRVSGAKPLEAFARIVDEELAFADRWRAREIDPAQTYAYVTSLGYESIAYDEPPAGLDATKIYPVPIEQSPVLGPANAPVTIVVFGDFECPFCVRGHETLRAIVARYGDEVRMVYKHFPLPGHRGAIPAARASMAAHAQGKFWEFHDALYERRARFSPETLTEIARALELDMERFAANQRDRPNDAQIKRDIELGMRLGVTGTPTAFVNGIPVEGAQPEVMVRAVIEDAREKARALRATGVAPGDVYTTLVGLPRDAP